MKPSTEELDVAEQLYHQYYCLTQVKQAIKALEQVIRLRERRVARRHAEADRFRITTGARVAKWQFAPMAAGRTTRFEPARRASVN